MMNHRFWIGALLLAFVLLPGCRSAASYEETSYETFGRVDRADDRLTELVPEGAALERLAEGFEWTEGPVWVPGEDHLLFSDIPRNTIYRWSEDGGLAVFLRPAGYMWADPAGKELGTNGLALDAEGRLLMADHGNRSISRLAGETFTKEILVDRYRGRRLNSPNDLVVHSSGAVYFTDPPYGLEGLNDSPAKELDFNGVYRLDPDGTLTLLTDELTFPNGIALSPDEGTLYVANSDPNRPIWMAYDLREDGTLGGGRVFFDAAPLARQGKRGMPDGMAVDVRGNLFATGPGGVLVFSPDGTHLGTIETGQATANVAFGGDGSTLYVTADMLLGRIPTRTKGLGF